MRKNITIHENPNAFVLTQIPTLDQWSYWRVYMDFIWVGTISGDYLISVCSDHRRIHVIGKDFSSAYIPEASTAVFQLQADADFILDDAADHLWFDGAGNQRSVTAAELYNFDYTRTLITTEHFSPYDVTVIGLLKSTVALTPIQIDRLHHDFELWIFWTGLYNDHGYFKDNRLY